MATPSAEADGQPKARQRLLALEARFQPQDRAKWFYEKALGPIIGWRDLTDFKLRLPIIHRIAAFQPSAASRNQILATNYTNGHEFLAQKIRVNSRNSWRK